MTKLSHQENILSGISYDTQLDSDTKFQGVSRKPIAKEFDISQTYAESEIEEHQTVSDLFEIPKIDQEITTDQIREINRTITRKVSKKQKNALVEERNKLVKKKFKTDLTKKEELRLTYVRWQLDRIDDAEFGEALDLYENITENYENFAYDLRNLLDQLGKKK